MKNLKKALAKIASKNIYKVEARGGDLERHWNDEEDFIDAAVWEIEEALKEAYELGRKEAKK